MQVMHFPAVLIGGHANFDVLGLLPRKYQRCDDYADYCGNGEASHYRSAATVMTTSKSA